MSAYRSLAKAYAHNKQCLVCDGGKCYDPFGKLTPGTYTASGVISEITKFSTAVYPPGTLCFLILKDNFYNESPATGDTIFITGTENFNGEHTIYSLYQNNPKKIVFYDSKNPANETFSSIVETSGWLYFAPTSKGELLTDALRVISHPGFPQVEGQGIYTYPVNPDLTRNFIYHPITKLDGIVQRTLDSNVFIMSPQVDEDIIITEVWVGGSQEISTYAEMARVFHKYWTTIPGVGEVLGWEPRDRTSDRFGVQLVRVQLGGIEWEYKEVRTHIYQHQGAMLDRQLTVQWKLAKKVKVPRPRITLIGR